MNRMKNVFTVFLLGCLFGAACIAQTNGNRSLQPDKSEGITREQADSILNELRQIRRLLENDSASPTSAPSPAAPRPVPPTPGPAREVRLKISPGWYAVGRDDAPITIVEFTDYQCPFCRRFHIETFPELKKQYIDTGKVRFVSRDMPLPFHANARPAALAVRCAGEQGKYWEMRDLLFQSSGGLGQESILKTAQQAQLKMDSFRGCMDAKKYSPEIEKDASDAVALSMPATPSFLVARTSAQELTGEPILGALPLAAFDAAITKLLEPAAIESNSGNKAPGNR